MLELFGVNSNEELLAQSISDTWVDMARLEMSREIASRNENLVDFEAERKRADGSTWWVLLNSQTIEFEGEPARIVWHNDITERKLAVQEVQKLNQDLEKRVEERTRNLNKSEELFRTIINHSPAKIHLKDKEGRYTLINKHAAKLYGVTEKTGLGQTIHDVFSERYAAEYRDHDQEAIATESAVVREERFDINGEIYTYQTTKFPIFEEGVLTGTGAIGTDITDRIQIEKHLQDALVSTEQASHSKTEFLATMSHELRTPLNAILGFSDMLRGQYFGPLGQNRYMEYAEDIHFSGEHLLTLINDILDISAIEAGKRPLVKETINLNLIISESIKVVAPAAQTADITISVEIADELPIIFADARAIKQIIINLLANAVKFSISGNEVIISAATEGNDMIIQVIDSGSGIASDILPTIIEPFARGDASAHVAQEGTGLGLAIVNLLVQAHNGNLAITSEVSKGTTVTITMPLGEE